MCPSLILILILLVLLATFPISGLFLIFLAFLILLGKGLVGQLEHLLGALQRLGDHGEAGLDVVAGAHVLNLRPPAADLVPQVSKESLALLSLFTIRLLKIIHYKFLIDWYSKTVSDQNLMYNCTVEHSIWFITDAL